MKKIKLNLLAASVGVIGLLAGCSSETTTGVDTADTNTENNQGNMGNTDTAATDTTPDTTYQNPPTDEGSGNQDQN
ncbi:hypothetical protein [Pontibacter burrus]|uniref:Uncharacterized protein n=1 Tax=Pontibacter burrus TaxID=2704466 RepID=A0A6B3M0V4_9BACT|nr:hypothetical protein [Pontibacter burrus]NEM99484.1 hypothetical protein [Pontibacter burrus]